MGKLIYVMLFLIFLFSTLNLTRGLNVISVMLVYGLLFALTTTPLFIKKKIISKIGASSSTILMFLFILVCSISALKNADYKLLMSSMVIALLYVVSFIVFPFLKFNVNKSIVFTVLISQIPLIFLPYGFGTTPYKGIFYNPNSMGITAGATFAVLSSAFFGNLESLIKGSASKDNFRRIKLFSWSLLMLGAFFLVMLSGSRTSFLTTVLCMFAGCFYLTVHLIKAKKIKRLLIRGSVAGLILSLVVIILFKFTPIYDVLYANIFMKFELRSSQGDMLSDRGNIWRQALSDAGLFGQGNDYFVHLGIGAHNSFVSITGQYGFVALFMFVLFLLNCFIQAIRYSTSDVNDKYKYLPLMTLIGFITMSMGEEMIFKLSMVSMFISLGSTLKVNNIKKEIITVKKGYHKEERLIS